MSDIINKFNTILKDKNIDLNNLNSDSSNKEKIEHDNNQDNNIFYHNNEKTENTSNVFSNLFGADFDISTLLKFKSIFDKANNKNNPRNQLLYSLKPFLSETRKEKLEQYTKIANILYVLNLLNEKGDNK